MLIDFTVSNYRSIKDPVTLSAVATKQRKTATSGKRRPGVIPDEEIASAYQVPGRDFGLLPVLGIFGANASGKTNVLRALNDCLLLITLGTGVDQFLSRKITPFLLDSHSSSNPTAFEISIAVPEAIYTYGLQIHETQIVKERLDYAPASTGRGRLLFERTWNPTAKAQEWKNGKDFHGPHLLLQARTPTNEPFLALVLRHLDLEVIAPLEQGLEGRWPRIIPNADGWDQQSIAKRLAGRPAWIARVSNFIRSLDTGVLRVEVENKRSGDDGDANIYSYHKNGIGEVRWSFGEESNGTQQLFNLAFEVTRTLEEGWLLIVDELDTSLHPQITSALVKLFQRQDTNPRRAQIIFTSHDNTLMHGNLLRRDQIWLTEKRRDQSTHLYSLSDYRIRNDVLIDLGYLNGRFGGVPILPSDDYLTELVEA